MQSEIVVHSPLSGKLHLLKDMFSKDCSDQEFEIFIHACQRTGLDPFMKQIYPVSRWNADLKRNSMTIQTGIDGYRLIGERTGKYAPGREPSYTYNDNGHIISCTAYVKKMTPDGTWHEVAATTFYEEYVQRKKDGTPTRFWLNMAHNQLAKCSEALALRKAFPAEMSGLYTSDEMSQADIESIDSCDIPACKQVFISTEQALYLIGLYEQCSPDHKKLVTDNLRNKPIYAEDFYHVPAEIFDRLVISAKKNIAQKSIKEIQAVG